MAVEESGVSIVLTPVQLYAWLNGKSMSHGEILSNSWHEMPLPSPTDLARFLAPMPRSSYGAVTSAASARQNAWQGQSHISQQIPPGCWTPPPVSRPDPVAENRVSAGIQLVFGAAQGVGGALLLLAPEPTMVTKVGGSILIAHAADTMQAAVRQLFSGRPINDLTTTGAAWAARRAGASEKSAQRIGVVMDVAVPFAAGGFIQGAERIVAIRAGRIAITSEEAVAGKAGRISLDLEEEDKVLGREGGHTIERHLNKTDAELRSRALRSQDPHAVISRFASKDIAEDAINKAVRVHRGAIQRWAANPSGITQEFELEIGSVIGDGFAKGTNGIVSLSRLRVVFKMSKNGGRLLYIVTAYPVP
jgi:hypothetical protein